MCESDKILILTPVKDAEPFLDTHFRNLENLTYPHQNISLGFLEGDSQDNTYTILSERMPELNKKFRKATVWKKDFGFLIPEKTPRWDGRIQHERRTILARSRNRLLFRALDDEDWVFWLDVDIEEYPPDIIQTLLHSGKEIIQPNCVTEYGGPSFDRNAWRDKGRMHLDDLRDTGEYVELHAVGGTMLLVRADIHRDGLIFPPYLYGTKNRRIRKHQFLFANWKERIFGLPKAAKKILKDDYRGEIETEGLGMMAHDMGHICWGMPNLEIKHQSD